MFQWDGDFIGVNESLEVGCYCSRLVEAASCVPVSSCFHFVVSRLQLTVT